ncbi:permease [Specibacter cremeus]|uniref:permease n=1 Tax=Specibacter cremeus TaxID=1629051 RepID=UPI000F77845B|nr:permease [Specibacter cremeus]
MKTSIMGPAAIIALAAIVVGPQLGVGYSVGVGVVLAIVFGFGWPHYLRIPARKTLGTVIAVAGAASAVAAGLTPGPEYLKWTPVFVALGFGAVMVVQLIRGTGQPHRLESTLGAGVGVVLASLGCGWVAAYRFVGEPGMFRITGVSALVALLVGMIRWPDRVIAPLAVVLAALAGPLAALLFSEVHIVAAAVIGALMAAIIISFRRLATLSAPPATAAGAVSMAVAPILSLGALVYFIDKLLLT